MSPRGVFVDQLCIICNIFEISRLMLLKKLPSHNDAPFEGTTMYFSQDI